MKLTRLLSRVVACGVACALTVSASLGLSGCAPEAKIIQNDALTILGYQSNLSNVYLQRIFELYEKETGTKLNIVAVENGHIDADVQRRFEQGGAPDILMHFNNGPLQQIGPADHFVPLQNEEWAADITESALAYATDSDGNLYGLPFWESSVSGCYYNKTLLDQLGLKPATTQAEFEQLCQALKIAGYTPLAWGDAGCTANYQFGLDPIFADNPSLLEKLNSGELTLSQIPQVTAMAEWIKKAADNGWFGDTANTTYDNLSKPIADGDAAMIFIWDTWFDTDFSPGKYTVDDFALMPIYMGTAPKGTYEGGNLNMMFVNKDSDRKEEALEFLRFCANPDNYNKAFEGVSTSAVFRQEVTNVESAMVREASDSVDALMRPSTAQPKIKGYDPTKVGIIFDRLIRGEIDVPECVRLLDESLKS